MSLFSSYTVPHYDTYYMLLINCQYQPYRVGYNITGNLTIVNENGRELYAGAIPNVVVFRAFAVIWGIGLGLWLCMRLKHDCTAHNARRIRYTHDLGKRLPHWSLTLIPLAQLIACALACELWKRIDVVGTFPTISRWDGPLSLSVSQNLFRTLAEVASYGVLFLLSTGTRVSRRRMTCKVFVVGLLFIVLLGVCSFFDQTYQFYTIGSVCAREKKTLLLLRRSRCLLWHGTDHRVAVALYHAPGCADACLHPLHQRGPGAGVSGRV